MMRPLFGLAAFGIFLGGCADLGDAGDAPQLRAAPLHKKPHVVLSRACPAQTTCCCSDLAGTSCHDTATSNCGTVSGYNVQVTMP